MVRHIIFPLIFFVAFGGFIAWAMYAVAKEDRAKQEACATKGGTYFSREAKCLSIKEIK